MLYKAVTARPKIFVDGGARRVRLYKFDTTLWATPTVNTETVQRLFTQAYNRMMGNRKQIIKDCETMRRALTDFAELDAEIERQLEETQVVAEPVKAAVEENASTAQSQEAYLRKYEALTERYEKSRCGTGAVTEPAYYAKSARQGNGTLR